MANQQTKPTMYLETSVLSYLASRPSNDVRVCANQSITLEWWEEKRSGFEVYISEIVLQEAALGDPVAAAKRLETLTDLPVLELFPPVKDLAHRLISLGPLPPNAELDAFHIALAAVHGMEYLLTWNCKHIANAMMRPRIEQVCRDSEVEPPVICTPLELMEVS